MKPTILALAHHDPIIRCCLLTAHYQALSKVETLELMVETLSTVNAAQAKLLFEQALQKPPPVIACCETHAEVMRRRGVLVQE